MARLTRFFVKGVPLHVIQRGNNRDAIFVADGDYRFYLECAKEAADKHGVAVHAYVLMTNHVHLLAMPANETSLPNMMQSLGRRYVPYFNGRYKRTGTLWEGRYRATLIDSERYLLTCMRYIELNPVRAGMVKRATEYAWSSHLANARGDTDLLIDTAELETIREATNKAWALGNDRFCARIEELTGRRATPLRRTQLKPRGAEAEIRVDV